MTLLKFHSQFCFSYGAFTAQRSCKQVLSTSIRIKLTSDNYHCDSQLCCQCQHHVSQRPKQQQPQKNVKIHKLLLLFTTLNAVRTISRNFLQFEWQSLCERRLWQARELSKFSRPSVVVSCVQKKGTASLDYVLYNSSTRMTENWSKSSLHYENDLGFLCCQQNNNFEVLIIKDMC